jgi:hypothetical protein
MKKLIKIYFWIGVNIIGIPELFIHEKQSFYVKSKFFGQKKQTRIKQTLELI